MDSEHEGYVVAEVDVDGDGAAPLSNPTVKLYDGDCGELPLNARVALVRLLQGPWIGASKDGNALWNDVLLYESTLRGRLGDIFKELVVDVDEQVAFIREADTGEMSVPRLLKHITLNYMDTVLVLELREILSGAHGQRITVSKSDLKERVSVYHRTDNTDLAGFEKSFERALERMVKRCFVKKLFKSDDYEVMPVLKVLFPIERIRELLEQYKMSTQAAAPGQEDADEWQDEEDNVEEDDVQI